MENRPAALYLLCLSVSTKQQCLLCRHIEESLGNLWHMSAAAFTLGRFNVYGATSLVLTLGLCCALVLWMYTGCFPSSHCVASALARRWHCCWGDCLWLSVQSGQLTGRRPNGLWCGGLDLVVSVSGIIASREFAVAESQTMARIWGSEPQAISVQFHGSRFSFCFAQQGDTEG